ncbi:MAG: energy transducer TonB [Burkholderiales bacterium]|uniref:energy transducer TonB n=1 Tax=Nitrosomonas sp. TaxID=42353 RepID=UPI001DE58EEC|nr:energy transducer TonB [Nitrosomonas sp.]MCB1950118.1 energy transducer TonB [Nitrosomonas sp.]MCP5242573.1 energy transducer TonB [Burkholderiales bacterium]
MHSLTRKNVDYLGSKQNIISLPGLLFVLVAHGVLAYILWNQRLVPAPEQMVTLFAEIISQPAPEAAPEPKQEPAPAKLKPVKKPEFKPEIKRLATKAPQLPEPAPVVQPDPEPVVEQEVFPEPVAKVPPRQMEMGPVTLSSELSVSCPKLTAPTYPAISRRMGEEGKLVLRVELDESGHIDEAQVIDSSGYARLDNAALEAVKNWQCRPSMRNGQPVRAIALQPFNFVLQGN